MTALAAKRVRLLRLPHVPDSRGGIGFGIESAILHASQPKELQPQRTRIGLWNVADIAGQITRPGTETEDPSDKDGGGAA